MATTTDDRPDRALLQQAIHWLVELRSGEMTPQQQQALQRWRQTSPDHEAAWSSVSGALMRSTQPLASQAAELRYSTVTAPVSYTHLTLPTIYSV